MLQVFRDEGCVALRDALPKARVKAIAEHVRSELSRLKLVPSAGSHPITKLPPFQQVTHLGQRIRLADPAAESLARELHAPAISLAGAPLAGSPAQLLLSLPHRDEWTMQRLPWHVDVSAAASGRIPGVQAFVLLDDVASRGGATLALAGWHRLSPGEATNTVRQLLKTGDDLARRLREHGLSVVEMTGRAGDVYLMDMRLLHSPSINATKHVRMMATVRYLAGPAR